MVRPLGSHNVSPAQSSSARVGKGKGRAAEIDPDGQDDRNSTNDDDDEMDVDGEEDVSRGNEKEESAEAKLEKQRKLRAQYRELGTEATDAQGNVVDTTVEDLTKNVTRANSLWKNVSAPSEAILDSRVLMATAAAAVTKARQLKIDSNAFDTNEFLTRLVAYMGGKRALNKGKKRQIKGEDEPEADQLDEGGYNWDRVGRLLAGESRRVPVMDFMYGPLELEIKEKKARVKVARQKVNENERVRPEELGAGDMEATKNETGRMVREVARVLDDVGVEGLPYLHLVTNPDSFAQTVENVFYLSFLVRENKCAIDIEDKEDSPFYGDLVVFGAEEPDDNEKQTAVKSQLVFEVTEKLWKDSIEAYNITESVIPHREDPQ